MSLTQAHMKNVTTPHTSIEDKRWRTCDTTSMLCFYFISICMEYPNSTI